jgi:DNA-directed RNA polymerase beta subunit
MEYDQEHNPDAMWDVIPGEDMVVCFSNAPLNYDDPMVVSSKFADYGGFSTLSVCTYRISSNDPIPNVGEEMCGKKYPWWKLPCTNHCTCTGYKRAVNSNAKKIVSSPRIPTGTVLESNLTETGDVQIKILSFAQLMSCDKISTSHGQKGTVRIVPQLDCPPVIMKDGTTMMPDLYMAVGSVVSRQTIGQVLESGVALCAARDGAMGVTADINDVNLEECDYMLDPWTGEPILVELPNGRMQPARATIGIIRVFNQTQMTRERHHLTHKSEGKYSLGTTPGRAAGGGVAAAEMDFHAMFSSGLLSCAQELLNRGNVVRVPLCTSCKHIEVLCDCEHPGQRVRVRMSYDVVVFDILSACANGSCNVYDIEHI